MHGRIGRRTSALVVAGLTILGSLAACSGGGSSSGGGGGGGKLTSIKIGGPVSAATLPMIVAQKQGFFKDNGLDSTFTTTVVTTLPQTVGKQFDIGMGVQPVFINALNAGVPLKAFAGGVLESAENPQDFIVAKPGSSITSVSQLAGARIGVGALVGNTAIAAKAFLAQNGVDPTKPKFVVVQNAQMLAQLQAGNVDAVVVTEPFGTQIVQAGGKNLGSVFVGDLEGLASFWFSSASWVSSHGKVISEFRKALEQTDNFISSHPDKAKQIYEQFTGLPAALVNAAKMPSYQATVDISALAAWPAVMEKYAGFHPSDRVSRANLEASIVSPAD